jgi:hypothetical protein
MVERFGMPAINNKKENSRFTKKYRCLPRNRSAPKINIHYNATEALKIPKAKLLQLCHGMRQTENYLFPWLEELGVSIKPFKSNYQLYLAISKKDYLMDAVLAVGVDKSKTLGFYLPKPIKNGVVSGEAYTYVFDSLRTVIHEYYHHLYSLLVAPAGIRDKNYNEGAAEWISGGVCSIKFNELLLNETDLMGLRDGSYARSSAFLWVSYLINEQLPLYTRLVKFLQAGESAKLKVAVNQFLSNTDHVEDFLDWIALRSKVCKQYNRRYSDLPSKPVLFLVDIPIAHNASYPRVTTSSAKVASTSTTTSQRSGNATHPTISGKATPAMAPVTEKTSASYSEPIETSATDTRMHYYNVTSLTTTNTETIIVPFVPLHSSSIESTRSNATLPTESNISTEPKTWKLTGFPPSYLFFLPGSFAAGMGSVALDAVGEKYPNLRGFIKYLVRPLILSHITASLDQRLLGSLFFDHTLWSLFSYLGLNYIGLTIADISEPICKKIAEKIHSQWIEFFIQVILWSFLWNPGLWMSMWVGEECMGMDKIISFVLTTLCCDGLPFSAGQWLGNKVRDRISYAYCAESVFTENVEKNEPEQQNRVGLLFRLPANPVPPSGHQEDETTRCLPKC